MPPHRKQVKHYHELALPEVHGLRTGFFENGQEPADLQAVPEKTLAKYQWHPKSHRDSATPPVTEGRHSRPYVTEPGPYRIIAVNAVKSPPVG